MLNESAHSLTRCKKNIQVLEEAGMITRQKAWFANQESYQYVLELRERLDETMKLTQAELENFKTGIARESDSPYASPMVVVKKKDGSNRICVDYRKLNRISVTDSEPMTTAKDLF